MRRILIFAFAALILSPALAKPASLVGRWSAGDCSSDVTVIGAMSLRNADVDCRFKTVQRQGNTVIWKGTCDGAEGPSKETVTARLTGKSLTYSYSPGGNVVEGLRRCGS
jgi:hypothetical protein